MNLISSTPTTTSSVTATVCPDCEIRNDMVRNTWGDYIIWTCPACSCELTDKKHSPRISRGKH